MAVTNCCHLLQLAGIVTAPGVMLGPGHWTGMLFLRDAIAWLWCQVLTERNCHAGSLWGFEMLAEGFLKVVSRDLRGAFFWSSIRTGVSSPRVNLFCDYINVNHNWLKCVDDKEWWIIRIEQLWNVIYLVSQAHLNTSEQQTVNYT